MDGRDSGPVARILEETEKNHVKYYNNNHNWCPGLDLITPLSQNTHPHLDPKYRVSALANRFLQHAFMAWTGTTLRLTS